MAPPTVTARGASRRPVLTLAQQKSALSRGPHPKPPSPRSLGPRVQPVLPARGSTGLPILNSEVASKVNAAVLSYAGSFGGIEDTVGGQLVLQAKAHEATELLGHLFLQSSEVSPWLHTVDVVAVCLAIAQLARTAADHPFAMPDTSSSSGAAACSGACTAAKAVEDDPKACEDDLISRELAGTRAESESERLWVESMTESMDEITNLSIDAVTDLVSDSVDMHPLDFVVVQAAGGVISAAMKKRVSNAYISN